MSVFISYKRTDLVVAQLLNTRLKQAGITTYLDVLDVESNTTEDITSVITKRVAECSHLLAIISPETASSWWVPFEIGEATIIDRRVASYQVGNAALPEYLRKWPVMKNSSELNFFIEEYNRDRSKFRDTVTLDSVLGSVTNKRAFAEDFHKQLKARVSRGF